MTYEMVDDIEDILEAAKGDIDQRTLAGEKTGILVKNSALPGRAPITYLTDTEQLHYLFSNNEGMTIESDVETAPSQTNSGPLGTHSPTSKYNALLLVTSERLLYLVGKDDETFDVSVSLEGVTSVSADTGILHHKLTVSDGVNRYIFRTGRQADISAATEYLEGQLAEIAAEEEQDTHTNQQSNGHRSAAGSGADVLTLPDSNLADQLSGLFQFYEEPSTLASAEECTHEAVRADIATVSRVHTELTADIEDGIISQSDGEDALTALQSILTPLSAADEALELVASEGADDEEVRAKLETAIEATDGTPISDQTLVQHRDALTEETSTEEPDLTAPEEEELLEEVRRLSGVLKKVPHHRDIRKHGQFDPAAYYDHYDDWVDVLEAADIDAEARLIEDLRRANQKVSGRLKAIEYDEHGTYSSGQVGNYFGSWEDALDEAALDISEEALLAEFRDLADDLGRLPDEDDIRAHSSYDVTAFTQQFESVEAVANRCEHEYEVREALRRVVGQLDSSLTMSKFEDFSEYTADDVLRHFDSWEAAIGEIGPTEELLIDDLRTAHESVSGRLTTTEYDERGTYTSSRIRDYFGSWDDGLEAANITVSKEQLVADFRELAEKLGKIPNGTELQEHTPYSVNTYTRRIGSLKVVAEEAGLDYEQRMNDALKDAAAELGHPPTTSEFGRVSEYGAHDVKRQYDSWSDAIETVDFSAVLSDDSAPPSNPLAEYYEAFSNLRRLQGSLVSNKLQRELPDDNPTVSWIQDINRTLTSGQTESPPGYALQQRERNPHTIDEYRDVYGDGQIVDSFEHIEVETPPEVVLHLASEDEEELADLRIPVDSEEEMSLPVMVETDAELARAREVLDRFPTYPDTADDVTDDTSQPLNNTDEGESEKDSFEADNDSMKTDSVDVLVEIGPVDSSIAEALSSAGFQSREALQEADVEQLADVEGVSTGRARRIKMRVGG